MIKCDIQLFVKEEIEVSGEAAAIYAEVMSLITEVMKKLGPEQRKNFEDKLRNEATWKMLRAEVKASKLYKGE